MPNDGNESGEEFLVPAHDASDPKAIELQKRASARRAKEDREVMKTILKSREGRSWMWRTLAGCSMFADPIGGDTHATYYNLGRQSVGKELLAQADKHSDLYLLMAKENR